MQPQLTTDQTDPAESNTSSTPPSPSRKRRRFSLRGFTSLLLTFAFLAMCFSGAMLFLTPRGRLANWTDWSLLGLGKHDWGSIHVNNSILFVVIAVLHLVLNWSALVRYIKSKTVAGLNMKKELALASVIAVICFAGPIYDVPPFSSLMALNENIKDYWEQNAEQPPVPHAEEMTLTELAGHIHLTPEQVTASLAEEGFQVNDAGLTVGRIGEQKGMAPNEVFTAIKKHHPDSRGWGRLGGTWGGGGGGGCGEDSHSDASGQSGQSGQGAGGGRGPGAGGGQGRGIGQQRAGQTAGPQVEEMTLTELAGQIHLSAKQVTSSLAQEGFQANDPSLTVGQIGEQKGVPASEIFAAIRKHHPDSRGWGRLGGTSGSAGGRDDDSHANAPGEARQGGGEGHGPGAGGGQGRGLGRGMGMGRGLGQGMGPGGAADATRDESGGHGQF